MILICAPTNRVKDYTLRKWISHINAISEYYGTDVALCDNTNDDGSYYRYLQSVCPEKWTIMRYEPKLNEATQTVISKSQNILRDYFLQNEKYTDFLFVEVDIYPPMNFIDRMLPLRDSINADVYSGLYYIDHGKKSYPMVQSAFIARNIAGEIIDVVAVKYNTLEFFSYYDVSVNMPLLNHAPIKVFASGFGCCLISRKVISDIEFRDAGISDAHSDSFFYADCFKKRYSTYLDSTILCNHDNFNFMLHD